MQGVPVISWVISKSEEGKAGGGFEIMSMLLP